MPKFRVTFMNHIVETYIVEAEDEDAAWDTEADEVEEMEPESWDCTECEVTDVEWIAGDGEVTGAPQPRPGAEREADDMQAVAALLQPEPAHHSRRQPGAHR